ncbi:MAG: hypothetical protein IBX55_16005 [Methyloprofundus sp.]|nr:hypothetical protein [Methyloprofundus sp.]
MPISLLKNAIDKYLTKVSFERPDAFFELSPRGTLKNTILNGNGLDIYILDSNRFRVKLQAQRFYEAITTDYHYSSQKIQNHRKIVETLLEAKSPGAWILVTAYYQSFYAANEILRLTGAYNSTFDKEAISFLNANNSTTVKLSESTHTYKGSVSSTTQDGNIEVTFQSHGDKPHLQVWQGLFSLLKQSNYSPTHKNIRRIERFKKIIDSSCKDFPIPSALRNKWNYSKIDAYDRSQDDKFSQMMHMLASPDFSNVKEWGARKLQHIDESTHVESLCYVNNILENTITHFHPKLKL